MLVIDMMLVDDAPRLVGGVWVSPAATSAVSVKQTAVVEVEFAARNRPNVVEVPMLLR